MKHAVALTQCTVGYGLVASLAPAVAAVPALALFVSASLALVRP